MISAEGLFTIEVGNSGITWQLVTGSAAAAKIIQTTLAASATQQRKSSAWIFFRRPFR